MEYAECRIEYKSRADIFKLYPLGDIHAGVKYCSETAIRAKVKKIAADPFARWVGMGDYADLVTPGDKRWDVAGIADWVKKQDIVESQRKWVVELFSPIRSQCLGLLEGNHEISIRIHNNNDFYMHICEDLGVTPLGYSCFLDMVFIRLPGRHSTLFRGHLEHGSGAAQSEGGQMNRLKKAMLGFEGDFFAMGHLHTKKIDASETILTVAGTTIKEKVRCAAITGSWYKSYEQGVRASYAEQKGYKPSSIGCPVFLFEPDKGIVDVQGGRERQ
jgi:hypothetical protein